MTYALSDGAVATGERLGCVQSLVRAFGILDRLAEHDEGQTLTQIARQVALPRSTTHRLLTTMGALRYVEFDATTNRWLVGMRTYTVGNAFAHARAIGRIGRPIMRSLMLEARETVSLAVSDRQAVCYVGQVSANDNNAGRARPGMHRPLHTTALGKALLAHWSEERWTGCSAPARSSRAPPTASRTPAGWSISSRSSAAAATPSTIRKMRTGVRCVAAPVLDADGRARAALSFSAPAERMTPQRIERLGHALTAATRRMAAEFGTALAD